MTDMIDFNFALELLAILATLYYICLLIVDGVRELSLESENTYIDKRSLLNQHVVNKHIVNELARRTV